VAVTDLGLSPKEFWRLTWYEWGLYMMRLYKLNQERLYDRDFRKDLTGQFMALFANANRSKGQRAFRREDFFKLSYDTQLKSEADPELFNRVARRLGSVIKKKDSGDK
jgi:hypothetical protein